MFDVRTVVGLWRISVKADTDRFFCKYFLAYWENNLYVQNIYSLNLTSGKVFNSDWSIHILHVFCDSAYLTGLDVHSLHK